MIWTLFRSPEYILDRQDTFQITQTLFRSSRNFSDNPDTLQMIWTLFRLPKYISDRQDTFQIIQTRYRSFRQFLLSFLSQRQFTGRLYSTLIKRKGLCLFSPQSFHARQTFEWIKPFDANFEMDRSIAGFQLPPSKTTVMFICSKIAEGELITL